MFTTIMLRYIILLQRDKYLACCCALTLHFCFLGKASSQLFYKYSSFKGRFSRHFITFWIQHSVWELWLLQSQHCRIQEKTISLVSLFFGSIFSPRSNFWMRTFWIKIYARYIMAFKKKYAWIVFPVKILLNIEIGHARVLNDVSLNVNLYEL